MRLLNMETLGFEEYIGADVPCYAILSHTWGDEEVSYAEFCELQEYWEAPSDLPDIAWRKIKTNCIVAKSGYKKIVDFSRKVKQDTSQNILHVWVDTCCINKSSSAELQEAINSMFRWYEKAQICFAYVSDVPPGDNPEDESSAFRASR